MNESPSESEETATEIEIEIDTRGIQTVGGDNAVEAEIETETEIIVREIRNLSDVTESDHDHAHQYATAATLRSVLDHLHRAHVRTTTGPEVERRKPSNRKQKTTKSL